jgi:hypothetical protein
VAGRVYTTQFLSNRIVGSWVDYIVPAGWRAVVRNVDCMNYSGVITDCRVGVGPALVMWHNFPAPTSDYHFETRAVAYAGEYIQSYLSHTEMYVTVTGYLFEDTTDLAQLLPVPARPEFPGPEYDPDQPARPK